MLVPSTLITSTRITGASSSTIVPCPSLSEDAVEFTDLDESASALLFHSVREVFSNIVKHAEASTVDVRLGQTEKGRYIQVWDNGVGFDSSENDRRDPKHLSWGLFSIDQRMRQIGGSVDIDSAPGKGATVRLNIPATRALADPIPAAS